ncbi:carbohydrate ABC transporter permease [Ruania rhizosphaerae]|uniref:carbohydrate ABC transporter permease n=1 Tax=Ruania rhizosphaerae TaxID=1840413 RepID=UPI0013567781|nr:carbohydrate ABC transporter permease [Ruania rhizosphaerae]
MIARRLGLSAGYAALIGWTLFVAVPLLFMFISSFKTHGEFLRAPLALPDGVQLENYRVALFESSLGGSLINSVVVTVAALALICTLSMMAGYALSRHTFPGNKVVLIGLVAMLAMPVHALVVPVYYFMEELGMRNSLIGLTLLYTAFGLPISIIIMRAYFENLPRAVEEAAMVDGCGKFGVFGHVAVPLAKASLATIAIINVVGLWSEYLFSSVLMTAPGSRTLPVDIAMLGTGQGGADFGLRFAGLSLATIPLLILYLVFSERIMKGITAGAVK